jgi:hypothetical protein
VRAATQALALGNVAGDALHADDGALAPDEPGIHLERHAAAALRADLSS